MDSQQDRTMNPDQRFQYDTLSHSSSIRLLRFSSSLPVTVPPTIELVEVKLSSIPLPTYKSLSYTWGNTQNLIPLQIASGNSKSISTINVTPNCAAALQRLYQDDAETPLWIDAICIDQNNLQERAQQVSIMRDVYKMASQIIIYVGAQEEDSETALSYFNEFSNRESIQSARFKPLDLKSSIPGAIKNFFARPWFERVWVLQEANWGHDAVVVLSGSGVTRVSWQAVKTASQDLILQRRFGLDHGVKTPAILGFTSSLSMVHHVNSAGNLIQRLHETRALKATDPRDKIFALLSTGFKAEKVSERVRMTQQALKGTQSQGQIQPSNPGVEINYSHSVAKAYTEMAKDLITRDRNLDVLSGVQCPSNIEGLPSWVPDWSLPPTRSVLAAAFSASRYNADGNQPIQSMNSTAQSAPAEFHDNDSTILIRGKRIATISMLSDTFIPGTTPNTLIKDWEEMIGEHVNHPIDEDEETTVLKVLIASKPTARDHGQFKKWLAASPLWREHWYVESESNSAFKGAPSPGTALYTAWLLGEKVKSACSGRRIFLTEAGIVGLAPKEAEIGDEVVVFVGGQVPFTLRKISQDDDIWNLVGECYAAGFMDGESMTWNENFPVRDFRLR